MNDSPTKERMAEDDKKQSWWLGWLVLALSFGAFVLWIFTIGLSLVVLPAITMIVVGNATRRKLDWCLGAFYCASYLLFGLYGQAVISIVLLATVVFIFVLNWKMVVGLLLVVVLGVLLLPGLCAVRQQPRQANDAYNIRQILLGIEVYHSESGVYPDRLSRLSKTMPSIRAFASPRGAGERDWFAIGPLRMWFRYNPGPIRQYQRWSEVDDGDYLYRQPSSAASSNTLVLITKPGLLYHNLVNIGYFSGRVTIEREQAWKTRQDVFEFLRDLNLTNLLSVTTGD